MDRDSYPRGNSKSIRQETYDGAATIGAFASGGTVPVAFIAAAVAALLDCCGMSFLLRESSFCGVVGAAAATGDGGAAAPVAAVCAGAVGALLLLHIAGCFNAATNRNLQDPQNAKLGGLDFVFFGLWFLARATDGADGGQGPNGREQRGSSCCCLRPHGEKY